MSQKSYFIKTVMVTVTDNMVTVYVLTTIIKRKLMKVLACYIYVRKYYKK